MKGKTLVLIAALLAAGQAYAMSMVVQCHENRCIAPDEMPAIVSVTRGNEQRTFVLNSTINIVCDEMQICRRSDNNHFAGEAPQGTYLVTRGYLLAVDSQGEVIAYEDEETLTDEAESYNR